MPQTDMNIANDSGANVRSDMNDHIAALVQLSSGSSAPGTTFAHMLWADTSPAGYTQFRVRDAADSAFSALFSDQGHWRGTDGTAALPGISFGADINSGFYRIGANNIGLSLDGVMVWDVGIDTTIFAHPSVEIGGSSARLRINNAGGGVNQKLWQWVTTASELVLRLTDDAELSNFDGMTFTRSQTSLTDISLNAVTNHISGAFVILPVTITTDTTPTAAGRSTIIIGAWTAANDITDFDNETEGQQLRIIGGDSDCNVVDGAPIQLVGDVTWNAAAGATLDLVSIGGVWLEINRSDAS